MTGATGLLGRQMIRTLSSTSWEARLGSTSWGPHHGAPSAQVLRLASVIFSSGYLDIDIPCLLFNTCRSHWHLVFASLFCIFWMILAGLWALQKQNAASLHCDLRFDAGRGVLATHAAVPATGLGYRHVQRMHVSKDDMAR